MLTNERIEAAITTLKSEPGYEGGCRCKYCQAIDVLIDAVRWRDPSVELPEDNEEVICSINGQSRVCEFIAAPDFESDLWSSIENLGGHYWLTSEVAAWLPMQEYKEDCR